jgi:hypothetical protein
MRLGDIHAAPAARVAAALLLAVACQAEPTGTVMVLAVDGHARRPGLPRLGAAPHGAVSLPGGAARPG